jgi:hypothetical protein
MPSFFAGAFALAGLAAAAGPVVIHLLHRRRFRRVEWAAMDFLREAMLRSRRILQLRDLLLLLLRTACVVLFGLAMARPYFSQSQTPAGAGQPVHAVLIVDNSLSMGYQRLGGTTLDEARAKAREFVEHLPSGSQTSIVPLCALPGEFSFDPYRSREDALEALQAIHVVDRQGSATVALDLALEACKRAPELPTKRVVLLGDQQAINWPAQSLESQLKQLPDLQVVQVGGGERDNAWVAGVHVRDGIADVETPTTFVANVRYEGPAPRKNVQVTLAVEGTPVASQTIDLSPGQSREISFPYRFDLATEPGRASFAVAAVSLAPDRLAADDARTLAVPVVAALPVLFVDQYGEDEDPAKSRYGETFRLRRLAAPHTSRGDYSRQLIQVRHAKIDELNRDLLQDVRLLVIAGVESPLGSVPLLREYLEQGGQVMIAAGGEFDPVAWNDLAWKAGTGILPAPLEPDFVGVRPDEAPSQLQPFFLDVATLDPDTFHIDDASREELADLYRQPIFFKTSVPDMGDDILRRFVADETDRIAKERAASTPASSTGAGTKDRAKLSAQPIAAHWLLWASERSAFPPDLSPQELAERSRPRALAAFTNRVPFLVERQIGLGRVLFAASGLQSDWNTLTTTNAVLIYDRLFRSMLMQTLPVRNLATVDEMLLPIELQDRQCRFVLKRPSGPQEPLTVDALGGELYGIRLRNMSERGIYRVSAYRPVSGGQPEDDSRLWEIPLAVNGSARESELATVDERGLAERVGQAGYRWVAAGDSISLEGANVHGQNLWRVLMSMVLVGLLAELGVLAWPNLSRLMRVRERAA